MHYIFCVYFSDGMIRKKSMSQVRFTVVWTAKLIFRFHCICKIWWYESYEFGFNDIFLQL